MCISHWHVHTVSLFLNQGKVWGVFLFGGFLVPIKSFTMSMTIALRGAPLTPTTRINLLWQQRQVSEWGTFSPNVSGLATYTLICWAFGYFFQPAFPNSSPQFSLLSFCTRLRHKMIILYGTKLAHFHWGKHLLVKFQVRFIVASDPSSVIFLHVKCKARIFLEKFHQTLHFSSCLTYRQFNSWTDQLHKANMAKR